MEGFWRSPKTLTFQEEGVGAWSEQQNRRRLVTDGVLPPRLLIYKTTEPNGM